VSRSRVALLGAMALMLGGLGAAGPAAATSAPSGAASHAVPHYDHVFVIVEENHGFHDVIANPAAPNLNALASRYGLATNYYGVTHPSEPNYVALLGGGTFGVADDNPYYLNTVHRGSLISQLDHAGISWKAYLQGVPHAGYQGICYPAFCNGDPDKDPLYVSKHDGIQNFTTSRNAADWSRQVPIGQLRADLRSGAVPSFGYVIPDECHDQHGDPPYCVDSGTPGGTQDQRLVATGDHYLGSLVSTITGAPFWARGNNAVVITYDEGNDNAGCCGRTAQGGKVATVVVTSHGPRHLTDPAPYSHYSLLQTIQSSFQLGCLAATCDTTDVQPMTPLFRPAGTPAEQTHTLPVPHYDTTSPAPHEPVSYTTATPTSGGWTVQHAPRLGAGDNSFGAVAVVSRHDVWTVGNFLPDRQASNPDATRPLAAHFTGTRWVSTPTPSVGPNFDTLFGVAARPGHAWAVGVRIGPDYRAHSLIETWNGSRWTVAATPHLASQSDTLFAASAVASNDVWAVGERQDSAGRFSALVEHWNGYRWTVAPAANPGASGNHLDGVAAVSDDDVWAVGQRNGPHGDIPLVEHWNGHVWSTVRIGFPTAAAGLLDAVAARDGEVWAVGETDDAHHQGRPLVEHYAHGRWTTTTPSVGSAFTNLTGVTIADNTPWAAGTYYDPAAGAQKAIIIHRNQTGWHDVVAPSPGTGDTVLGGIAASGPNLWAVGYAKNTQARQPLIEHHQNR